MYHHTSRRKSLRRVTVSFTLVATVLVLALAFGPGAASAQNVLACTTIDGSGEYTLEENIVNSSERTCFNVTVRDVGGFEAGIHAGKGDAGAAPLTIRDTVVEGTTDGITTEAGSAANTADMTPPEASTTPAEATATDRARATAAATSNPNNTTDWSTLGGNDARTGQVGSDGPTDFVTERWNVSLQTNAGAWAPAVVDGVVYVGNTRGRVLAIDRKNGTVLWNVSTGERVEGPPTVAGGTVYVTTDNNSAGAFSRMYALDADTGAKLWNFSTGGPPIGSPAVVGGTVYVSTLTGTVYALNAITGAEEWNNSEPRDRSSSPAVVDGRVYVGNSNGYVYALDAADGSTLWNNSTEGQVFGTTAVANGTVYAVDTFGGVYAWNATTGAQRWKSSVGGEADYLAVANGTVYINEHFGPTADLVALDAWNGSKVWDDQPFEHQTGETQVMPAVANGSVYVARYLDGNQQRLKILDAGTGAEQTVTDDLAGYLSAAAVVGGDIYVGGDETVYALRGREVQGSPDSPVEVASCTTIEEPGWYALAGNVTGGTDACLEVAYSNVVLDGRGYTVDGNGSADVGIRVGETGGESVTNVTVANLTVARSAEGINASDADGVVVRNVTVRNATTSLRLGANASVGATGLRVGESRQQAAEVSFDATTGSGATAGVRPSTGLVAPPDGQRSVFRSVDVEASATASFANFEIAYADADASNLDESTLRGWTYDGTDWTERAGSIDAGTNVVTVDALTGTNGWVSLAPLGASTDPAPSYAVAVDRTDVVAGESVTITVTVSNAGDEMLDRVGLTSNGRVVDERTVLLPANGSRSVTLNRSFPHASPGETVFEFSVAGTSDAARVTLAGVDRPPQPDWTGWHLPPENDNTDPGLAPPRPPLSLAWNTSVPDGSAVPMKPIVVDDTLYAYTYLGTFAMDARTGEVLWNNSQVNGTYLGGIAYDDGRVFVSTTDDGLKALDASTGEITWNRNDISSVDTAPVVLNDTVFIGGDDSDMWALDHATGATVWNHTYATNGDPADYSSPTAANGRVFVPGSDGTLYAHDADNGSLVWTRDIGYSEATPAVKDGIVYAADSGSAPYLQALDAETGETVWNATAGLGYTGLAVTDDTVFMATCGDSLFAYNATTGDLRWNRSDIGCAYDISEPVVASGVVYSTTYGDRTLALDAETGETVYDFEMPGCCKGTSPVPYDGRLYVAARYSTGEVYAFGGPEWPRLLPDQTLVNESTDLRVLREYSDDPIANATLRIEGTTLTTDDNGTATYTFESGGTYEVAVSAPDTDRTDYVETRRTITVGVSDFAATLDSTNAPITEGETLRVNATIENTGATQQTQIVTLSVGGATRDSVSVTLAPGDSQSVSLAWNTSIGDGDTSFLSAQVTSQNDSDSTPVKVRSLEPANFSVDIVSTNSPITEGQTLNLSVNVTNTGDLQGTQTIDLSVGGTQRASRVVTLAAGASKAVTLSWTTQRGDVGNKTVTLASANDSASAAVTIESSDGGSGGPTIAPGQPGFGPAIALFGLVAVVIVATRRRGS